MIYSYDNLGNVATVDYGDSTPDISYIYDLNNNVDQVTVGGIVHDYSYNDLNLLSGESITIDGKTFSLGYGFDVLGEY